MLSSPMYPPYESTRGLLMQGWHHKNQDCPAIWLTGSITRPAAILSLLLFERAMPRYAAGYHAWSSKCNSKRNEHFVYTEWTYDCQSSTTIYDQQTKMHNTYELPTYYPHILPTKPCFIDWLLLSQAMCPQLGRRSLGRSRWSASRNRWNMWNAGGRRCGSCASPGGSQFAGDVADTGHLLHGRVFLPKNQLL